MMQGIEILNQTELMTMPTLLVNIAYFVLVILLIVLIVTLFCYGLHFDKAGNISVVSALIASFILLILVIASCLSTVPSGEYVYQVTVDETVSMLKFYEKYEIIKVEGNIWTIKEK